MKFIIFFEIFLPDGNLIPFKLYIFRNVRVFLTLSGCLGIPLWVKPAVTAERIHSSISFSELVVFFSSFKNLMYHPRLFKAMDKFYTNLMLKLNFKLYLYLFHNQANCHLILLPFVLIINNNFCIHLRKETEHPLMLCSW